jgi:UDP-N-acetylmuramoyl-tripeptide--D-alanyl-D-alanine ligase
VLKAGGGHNISNALGAAAAASAAGASLDDIVAGLSDFRAVSGRLQLKPGLRGSWIIDDSYNANPSSVRAGLDVLRSVPGNTWLVLADMAELGGHSDAMRASAASSVCSRSAPKARARPRRSVRAPSGSRTRIP